MVHRTDPALIYPALVIIVISNIFFELGYVFYNGMLPGIVAPEVVGRASAWGWSSGYFGALVCMSVAWFVLLRPQGPGVGLDHG